MKQHAIMIVGPDGVGKTTVSQEISRLSGLPRFKCPSEKQMFKSETFLDHLSFDLYLPYFVEQAEVSFVSDRSYVCEYAYATAYGRKTDEGILVAIDNLWKSRGGEIVLLLKRSYDGTGDDLVGDEMLPVVHDCYLEFVTGITGLPRKIIYTDDFYDRSWATDIAKEIIEWSAHHLIEPRDSVEWYLYDYCTHVRVMAQHAWKAGGDVDELGSINTKFRILSTAYFYLTSGSPGMALETLIDIDRGELPNQFWEALGRLL